MNGRASPLRPTRDLLVQLAALRISPNMDIDGAGASISQLQLVIENADEIVGCFTQGVAAIGQLLAHSAVAIEAGDVCADSLERLGFWMAESADFAASCVVLAAACRQHLAAAPNRSGFETGAGAPGVWRDAR